MFAKCGQKDKIGRYHLNGYSNPTRHISCNMQKSSLDNVNNNRKTTWLLSTYIFAVNHKRRRKEKGNDEHSHTIHGCNTMAEEIRIPRS